MMNNLFKNTLFTNYNYNYKPIKVKTPTQVIEVHEATANLGQVWTEVYRLRSILRESGIKYT